MDLRQLEYFVRVAELGSFTRAAIALDIAQPALSRQVRLLEVELRQNLLVRNGRGAAPTEAGKLLLEHARGIHSQRLVHVLFVIVFFDPFYRRGAEALGGPTVVGTVVRQIRRTESQQRQF